MARLRYMDVDFACKNNLTPTRDAVLLLRRDCGRSAMPKAGRRAVEGPVIFRPDLGRAGFKGENHRSKSELGRHAVGVAVQDGGHQRRGRGCRPLQRDGGGRPRRPLRVEARSGDGIPPRWGGPPLGGGGRNALTPSRPASRRKTAGGVRCPANRRKALATR